VVVIIIVGAATSGTMVYYFQTGSLPGLDTHSVVVGGQSSPQVAVTATALLAADFLTGGSTDTFTCATSPSRSYLTLVNTGADSASVASISVTWGGGNTAYTLSGSCNIGASGSAPNWATIYVNFPAISALTPSAIAGQTYSGVVTLSNGAQLLFIGTFQPSQVGQAAQIAVTETALVAADFLTGGTTKTFACATSSSLAYLTLTNTGKGTALVTRISITWAGGNTTYTVSGTCNVGASGSGTATIYIIFPLYNTITPSAIVGQTYTGTVTLSDGEQILFTGTWR
jgi:hypothetical protein